MKRDLQSLSQHFDLLVIGAGTHGACIARLAAQGGLKVALIEKGDFGAATSRNSAKLLHGGLRYIQHFDVPRIRESMIAQRAWFRYAPHLVRPLQFVIPTYGYATRGPAALAAGILAFHMIAAGRNAGIRSGVRLPPSGVMSRRSLVTAYPMLARDDVTGGAYWYDGQMLDAVRLTIELVLDAVEAGAVAINHLECVSFLNGSAGVVGAVARDALSGRELEVRAGVTINATGPWVDHLLECGPPAVRGGRSTSWTRNINLVTRPLYAADVALGVASHRASDAAIGKSKRLFFMSPWQGCTVVGTTHDLCADHPDAIAAPAQVVAGFIDEVNEAMPGTGLKAEDVHSVHLGLTPSEDSDEGRAKRSLLVDHEARQGVLGLISVAGIKYTTAPVVAAHAVDLACRKLGKPAARQPFEQPASGAPDGDLPEWSAVGYEHESAAGREFAWTQRIFGQRAAACLADGSRADPMTPEQVLRCRVKYGIEHEMVVRLTDAVLRATDSAERGLMTGAQLEWCADTMQAALGWTAEHRQAEMAATRTALDRLRVRLR